jgi:MFS family permease
VPHENGGVRLRQEVVLSRDRQWLFAAKALRTFSFGWLSVILALYLSRRGLSSAAIGTVFTATMVEDAILTIVLSVLAARVGPRRIMILTAPLITLGGTVLAITRTPTLLIVGAILGTLSPNGQEAGAFSPLEQAMLVETVTREGRTRAFGWYNIFGFVSAAFGSLAAGAWLSWAARRGIDELGAYRFMLWVYAAIGLLLCLPYALFSRRVAKGGAAPELPARRLGLSQSRRVVLELSGLQAVDALAGGFILQGLLAYWFHNRFGVGADVLGPLFFGTNLLSALSFLAAPSVADRIGLLNTMVFTHLPSNVLLLLVPLMPSFPAAAAALLVRHLLSQMDVPTRQAYIMALVAPAERPAAAGLTSSARALAQSVAPALSGLAMRTAGTALPFLFAGALKSVYDLSLYRRFRSVPLRS